MQDGHNIGSEDQDIGHQTFLTEGVTPTPTAQAPLPFNLLPTQIRFNNLQTM